MNLTLNPILHPLHPAARNQSPPGQVPPALESVRQGDTGSRQPVSPPQKRTIDYAYNESWLLRRDPADGHMAARVRQAIQAYSAMTEFEQRDRVRELFGFNEYA